MRDKNVTGGMRLPTASPSLHHRAGDGGRGDGDTGPDSLEQLHRNQLTVIGTVCLMSGFVLAAWFGAFLESKSDYAPNWIQAVSSATATIISFAAVLLLARTLAATRDTLRTTQEMTRINQKMADDQKSHSDKQLRPWLMPSELENIRTRSIDASLQGIRFRLKNFGQTPASYVAIRASLEYYDDVYDPCLIDCPKPTAILELTTKEFGFIAPNDKGSLVDYSIPDECIKSATIVVRLSWHYSDFVLDTVYGHTGHICMLKHLDFDPFMRPDDLQY